MKRPATRYALSGALKIAYQVWGEGGIDIVLVPGFISHIDLVWDQVRLAGFLSKLARFARVIAFDKRGMGMSDGDPARDTPTMNERMDDIRAVMHAAGSDRAFLLSWSEGGPAAISVAVQYPRSIAGLILIATTARFTQTDDFPEGVPRFVLELFIDALEEDWGSGVAAELYAPSLADDEEFRSWWARYQGMASSPGAVAASLRMHLEVDVRSLLPHIKVPTLILHRRGDMQVPVACGQHLARSIAAAEYIELQGEDHMYWIGNQDEAISAIQRFLGVKKTRGRPSTGWDSLTDRELDVAPFVIHGMNATEIAAALYISERTVHTHIDNMRQKLDASSRTELAAIIARHIG